MTETREPIAPGRILAVLLRGWWIIFASAILGGALAFAYSSTTTPIFQSSASIYFSMRSATSGSDINQGSVYTQSQMLSFAQLAMTSLVLDRVRDDLDVDLTNAQIRNMTSASIPQNTVILEITAGSPDAAFASDVANSISGNLAQVVGEVAPVDDSGTATIVARIIQPAVPAVFQSSPDKQRDALLGAFAGGILAALALIVWALVDTRVRSEDVLRRVTDLPLLGALPLRQNRKRLPIVALEPNGSSAEAYRAIRSGLRFSAVEHAISALAVTSSIPGEGKTTTAVNLALTYSEAGMRVLLVDADFRRPQVAETLGIENAVGLTTMLVGAVDFEDAKVSWGDREMWVLPAGEVPPNPAELLASAKMAQVLDEIKAHFDIMIVDTAPLLSVADATIIAQNVDSTIVVVDVKRARIAQLSQALGALRTARAEVAGVIFTRVKRRRRDDYYYSVSPTPSASSSERTTLANTEQRRSGEPAERRDPASDALKTGTAAAE